MLQPNQIQRPEYILVVDDQEINRDVLGSILEDRYGVLYAADGLEALDIIRAHADEISLIMLDLIMPVMDGFGVLEAVRADDRLRQIPVIVLTADKDAELRALRMGALDFITKPFDMHEVIRARVDRAIELCEDRHLISAAEHDQITGLYSYNFFYEYAHDIYTYHPEDNFDAIALNINQFHSLNALNGRDFGDEILAAIGAEIIVFLSETPGIAGREDADRFVIFCEPQDDYSSLLMRIQSRVDATFTNSNICIRMGVNKFHKDVEPFRLFDRARAACNMVRGDYQHRLMIFNDDLSRQEMLHRRLLNDLDQAVETRQLKVFYQPKYEVQCDPPRLSSAEALIRWVHPDLGFIAPNEFIPLLEGNGLISVVDAYVWQETAVQIAAWREKYGFTLPVSVNLSRADVFDRVLTDHLKQLVEKYDLSFKDLQLELTESAYTENAKQLVDVIDGLREMGFEIEMDDFGSGYSSLNMLSSMPLDVLKIDMKFVRNIETNETDRRLVQLIIDIAQYLKVKTIAEGAETKEQVELLKELGVDVVQGYYFSRPLPPEDFEALIEKEISIKR